MEQQNVWTQNNYTRRTVLPMRILKRTSNSFAMGNLSVSETAFAAEDYQSRDCRCLICPVQKEQYNVACEKPTNLRLSVVVLAWLWILFQISSFWWERTNTSSELTSAFSDGLRTLSNYQNPPGSTKAGYTFMTE